MTQVSYAARYAHVKCRQQEKRIDFAAFGRDQRSERHARLRALKPDVVSGFERVPPNRQAQSA